METKLSLNGISCIPVTLLQLFSVIAALENLEDYVVNGLDVVNQ